VFLSGVHDGKPVIHERVDRGVFYELIVRSSDVSSKPENPPQDHARPRRICHNHDYYKHQRGTLQCGYVTYSKKDPKEVVSGMARWSLFIISYISPMSVEGEVNTRLMSAHIQRICAERQWRTDLRG
jgi:hypothetical protein